MVKDKGGRREYRPSKKDRRIVKYMSSYGMSQNKIVLVLGRSLEVLRKYYRHELDLGETERIMRVAEVAYLQAVSGRFPSMTMFYLKTRGKWRETEKEAHDKKEVTASQAAEDIRNILQAIDTVENIH